MDPTATVAASAFLGGMQQDACAQQPLQPLTTWTLVSEAAGFSISAMLWALYVVSWQRTTLSSPLLTTHGLMQAGRASWVRTHLMSGMLPVNTLRDLIRAATFFASSALAILLAVAGYTVSVSGVMLHKGHVSLDFDASFLLFLKLLSLMALHGFNFAAFIQATKYITHVSFLINTSEVAGRRVTERVVWRMFSHATKAWSAGSLGMMATFPLVLWIFGPLWLTLGTAALLAGLRLLDWGEYEDTLATGNVPFSDSTCSLSHSASAVSVAVPTPGEATTTTTLRDPSAEGGLGVLL